MKYIRAVLASLMLTVTAAPLASSLLPVSAQVHVHLIPDGDFTGGSANWGPAEGMVCNDENAQGMPAPSLHCALGLSAAAPNVNCPPGSTDPNQCNSHVDAFGQGAIGHAATLVPVFVGTVQAQKLMWYEASMDYRAKITGTVDGSSPNRFGNANLNIFVTVFDQNGIQISGAGLGGTGAGTCCGPDQFSFNTDTLWQSSPRVRLTGLAEHSGEDVTFVVGLGCEGHADEFGSFSPVSVNVNCDLTIDNVNFDAVISTP